MITYAQQLNYAKVFGESLFYGADCVLMIAILHIQLCVPFHPSVKGFVQRSVDLQDIPAVVANAQGPSTMTGTVPPRVLQSAVAVSQINTALGDFVLIWRVWVVWSRDYRVVVIPVLLLIVGFVAGILSAMESTNYDALSKILPMPTTVLGVVNTTLCTALIAGRLAYVDHLVKGIFTFNAGRDRPYRATILMVVESGAVLTAANVIGLVLERRGHPGLHVMLNIQTPLTYMVPTSIIVLSHFRLVPGDAADGTSTTPVQFASHISISLGDAASTGRRGGTVSDPRAALHRASQAGLEDVEKQVGSCGAA
ncbi:uncharacterized protein BXZ73DRAFT_98143 [Epithele typhae]|uniref:uncharacterized protein n=1 Tax=Epithele typhae TaxID=378194 RepID=UPI002007FEDB|nr:uncharacterized protein BXZ73DRAFT_98143 [Epithele typhae]KAH9941753.1 hypothetical protein BXZ73DRAFT_98143 [Epithele typhae]